MEGEEAQGSDVSAVLADLRAERDWSQAVLARRARVGVATIARIESRAINRRTGKVDMPRPQTLRRLAHALGDGSAERARAAQRKLLLAAGYLEEEPPPKEAMGAAPEIAHLRSRIEALERQLGADPHQLAAQLQRVLDTQGADTRAAAIRAIRETLARYERVDERPDAAAGGENGRAPRR